MEQKADKRIHHLAIAFAFALVLIGATLLVNFRPTPVEPLNTPEVIAAPPEKPAASRRPSIVQTTFKSVDAVLAGQWDFPERSPAPLVVLIPPGGKIDRNGWSPDLGDDRSKGIYSRLTHLLVDAGFAVFRFDKPGAGQSSIGRFSTHRSDAIEAYTHAVNHARIDPEQTYILGHSSGSDAIAGIYPRYEDVAAPAGVIFLDNTVGEQDSTRVHAPLLIINSDKNPDDRQRFGSFVVEARSSASDGPLETELVLLDEVQRGILVPSGDQSVMIDRRATTAIVGWLRQRRADQSEQTPKPS